MSKVRFENIAISGITTVVPERILNIDDEIEFYNNDIANLNRIKKILGLGTRHVVEEGQTLTDLCEQAANSLFHEMKFDRGEIDALIVVSISHDYSYPATACILQHKLQLKEDCACLDTNGLACSGYVYGLWLAHSLIAAGSAKKVLLLAGDVSSQHANIKNRNSHMLFGDAASATIIESHKKSSPSYFLLGTQGIGWNKLIMPAGGAKLPIRKDIVDIEITDTHGNLFYLWDECMRGMNVFQFMSEIAPKSVTELLDFSGETLDSVDYFAFHQGNKQIVRTASMHANIPKGKSSFETFTKYGNCATASVVTVLCDQLHDKQHEKVMLCTFGVGLSWGFCLVDLKNTYNGGIKIFKKTKEFTQRKDLINNWIAYYKGEIDDYVE